MPSVISLVPKTNQNRKSIRLLRLSTVHQRYSQTQTNTTTRSINRTVAWLNTVRTKKSSIRFYSQCRVYFWYTIRPLLLVDSDLISTSMLAHHTPINPWPPPQTRRYCMIVDKTITTRRLLLLPLQLVLVCPGTRTNRYHSLTPYLCSYYTISVINFLHLSPSVQDGMNRSSKRRKLIKDAVNIASSLIRCRIRQSISTTPIPRYSLVYLWVLHPALCNPCIFTQSFSSFQHISLQHCNYIIYSSSHLTHYVPKNLSVTLMYHTFHYISFSSQPAEVSTISRRLEKILVSTFWATVFSPMLSDRCPVCLSVCNVGVLWPNGWMDQDATWQECIGLGQATFCQMLDHKWGPSSPRKGAQQPHPHFSAHVCCG